MAVALILSLICIACAYLCWTVADKRGGNTLFWAVMGALLGPIAVPFVFLLKKKLPENDH